MVIKSRTLSRKGGNLSSVCLIIVEITFKECEQWSRALCSEHRTHVDQKAVSSLCALTCLRKKSSLRRNSVRERKKLLASACREKTLRMPMVTRRLRDPDVNPCLSESDASTRCMAENNYDKESCSSHFLKYKNCRKFWNSVMIQRRQNGVKPPMPTAAERDEILEALGKMPY
ncbi:PREDICTED: coiled-coil-helix-coiled-coil-helix domain-containing protein 7 isoform X1 [Capra hircus]|nr:PREDICTED: coiled-coil-helix-coiled-coil-helix domain-containing protein 7 isoform X1 [Capra hircus]